MIADRANMLARFQEVMQKLSLLGFNQSTLTNCSDVIPVPTGTVADPFIPAGLSTDDIQAACSSTPFPSVSVIGGGSAPRKSPSFVSNDSKSQALSLLSPLCESIMCL